MDGRSGEPRVRVVAWPRGLRWFAAALIAFAGLVTLQLAVLLTLDVVRGGMHATPRAVVQGVVLGVLVPLALVSALRRLFSARILDEAGQLRIVTRFIRIELPAGARVSAHPWWVPLPAPGEWWEVETSGRLSRELEGRGRLDSSVPLFEPSDRQTRAARAFAEARSSLHRDDLWAYAFKYVLFPILPAAVIFYSFEHITYGGWNAEYQLYGLKAWLASAGLHWVVTVAHLVVIGGAFRVAAELVCFSAAWLSPGSAGVVRRIAEWFCRLVYYGGIPALLALRFLA